MRRDYDLFPPCYNTRVSEEDFCDCCDCMATKGYVRERDEKAEQDIREYKTNLDD